MNAGSTELTGQLRATLGKMEVALSAVGEAIVWTDAEGSIQWCNAAFDRLVDRPHIANLGAPLISLLPLERGGQPLAPEAHPATVALTDGVTGRCVYEVRRADNASFVEVSAVRIRPSEQEANVVLTIQDITERRRAEQALQDARDAAEAANREVEAFSYSVSHDLRAPLRSIDGFSQALLEEYAGKIDGQGIDYLRRVRAAAQRMGRLIDDLLALSRLTRTEMCRETTDLSALANLVAIELRQGEPKRQVTFVIAEDLVAEGDPRLLRVVLENLLDNAWKFTSKHARATIEFGTTQHEGRTTYFVRDDGAGFDMAYAGKLFTPFQRLHGVAEFEGNGIGLATVRRIIHRHGGRVWAEGAIEKGATVYFTL